MARRCFFSFLVLLFLLSLSFSFWGNSVITFLLRWPPFAVSFVDANANTIQVWVAVIQALLWISSLFSLIWGSFKKYINFDLPGIVFVNRFLSQFSISFGTMNNLNGQSASGLLTQIDIDDLISLLDQDDRTLAVHTRISMIRELGFQPASFPYISEVSGHDFSVRLITDLNRWGNNKALCRLSQLEVNGNIAPELALRISNIRRRICR